MVPYKLQIYSIYFLAINTNYCETLHYPLMAPPL
jgi:hypothetical protein